MNAKWVKVLGVIGSLVGVGATLLTDWVNDKKIDQKIDERLSKKLTKEE